MSPLVTVYITNYNYGAFIAQAIESVLNQTLQNFELIIIDDGSTDNSKEVIERYESHPKIDVIFQLNKGLNVTNNIALRAAKGNYIVRLDADDYFHPQALELLSEALDADKELGLVFPDYYYVDENGQITEEFKRHDFSSDVSLLDQAAHGACTMIRTEYLRKLGGYNESFSCQDGYELWVKFIAHYKVANVSQPLFYYRRHSSNLTRNESRILSTRAKINEVYSNDRFGSLRSVCVIPVRDESMALRKLGDYCIIDYRIMAASTCSNIEEIIISSPSSEVRNYVELKHQEDTKVHFHLRKEEDARLNVALPHTIHAVLDSFYTRNDFPDAITVLTIEFPFTESYVIADAIHTLFLFDSDSLISVRQEGSMLFQHKGSGMQAILNQDKVVKLEREALYKLAGGITVVKTENFLKHDKLLTGKIGHIMMDQLSSFGIFTDFDLQLAEWILEKKKKNTAVQSTR